MRQYLFLNEFHTVSTSRWDSDPEVFLFDLTQNGEVCSADASARSPLVRCSQYADCNLVQPKSKGKGKDGKDARNESSEKVKDDDQRKCFCCREAGHTESQSRTRLQDLANAEWKSVTANSRTSSTAAVAPLADDHVTTFLVTVPHVKRKSSCACVKIETTMRSDAGSTAPTRSERVKLISAIPTCKTCLMTDIHFHRKLMQSFFFFWGRGLISLCSYSFWRRSNYFLSS